MVTFVLNGEQRTLDVDPDMPLLWALRDHAGLTGTKFGCGLAQCGACTVQRDGVAIRSCQTPVGEVEGASITTIEGARDRIAEALRDAWVALDVPQCGYCQSGQIMSAAALLAEIPRPTDADIEAAMTQVEGGIGFGLGAILQEEVTFKGGTVEQANYDTYRPLRLDQMPQVEVHIVDSADPPTGIGEPGVPPVGPAVANAVARLTGRRIRVLPFTKGLQA